MKSGTLILLISESCRHSEICGSFSFWERRYVYNRWPPFKRKGRSSVLREPASIDGQWNRLQLFKLFSQGDTQRSQILEA